MRTIEDIKKTLEAEGYTNLGLLNSGMVVIPEGAKFEELDHIKSITIMVCYSQKLFYTQDSSD